MPKLSLPENVDALKLATQQWKWVDLQQDVVARGRIYRLLCGYLIVLVAYSAFLIVAIGLKAAGIWAIPWSAIAGLGVGDFGLGASSYFFRVPMTHLFRGH